MLLQEPLQLLREFQAKHAGEKVTLSQIAELLGIIDRWNWKVTTANLLATAGWPMVELNYTVADFICPSLTEDNPKEALIKALWYYLIRHKTQEVTEIVQNISRLPENTDWDYLFAQVARYNDLIEQLRQGITTHARILMLTYTDTKLFGIDRDNEAQGPISQLSQTDIDISPKAGRVMRELLDYIRSHSSTAN